jgi:hypothetical protein
MSDTPPVVGQEPWGDDLNAYLAALEARIAAVESRPEYVYSSYSWQYSSAAPPPTGSQVRFNNASLPAATIMVARLIDNDGGDRTALFRALDVDSHIRINDWDDADTAHRFSVTGPVSIDATDVTIPVVWISGAGTIPNAKVNVSFLVALEVF